MNESEFLAAVQERCGMNIPPTASVILPVYNGEATLKLAVNSVLAQTHPPLEIIVIDDGSTDRSTALLAELQAVHTLKVIEQDNQGQSAARNAGAQLAGGDLLAFIDQDDLWHPRHLERLSKRFAYRTDVGLCYSDFDEIDSVGHTVTQNVLAEHDQRHPKTSLANMLCADLMILPSAAIVRATAFRQVGGFDPNLCGYEDDDLFIRLFREGWRSEFVRTSLTKFRVHSKSASASSRFQQSRIIFLDKLMELVPNNERLNRYYIDDLAFPRLFQASLSEYATCLRMHDFARAREMAQCIEQLSRRAPGGVRRRTELALLHRPEVMARLLRVHDRVPRRLRPHINPALMVRSMRRTSLR